MRKRTKAREIAMAILYQLDVSEGSLDELLATYWEDHEVIEPEIKQFAERILRGTVQELPSIDAILTKYADNWHLERMAVIDRNILRFAIYELLYMPDIPPKVTINESVNIAKKFSLGESGKFVNGVLDKINHTEKPRI
ncbi:MAG: transcription antitermination factor NusB [Candidatus Omnitrophica bacterium]|nr:transcription antitermination factor NusB [Candidatus Omnitrophota bacterium]